MKNKTVRERTGHQPSYAEAKKTKSQTLHTHGGCFKASFRVCSISSSSSFSSPSKFTHYITKKTYQSDIVHPIARTALANASKLIFKFNSIPVEMFMKSNNSIKTSQGRSWNCLGRQSSENYCSRTIVSITYSRAGTIRSPQATERAIKN